MTTLLTAETAVDEALRVLMPGGVLLVDFGGVVKAPWHGDMVRIAARHDVTAAARPGATDPDEVTGHLAGRATHRALSAVSFAVTRTLAEDLDNWEQQIFSWSWGYLPEQMRAVCGHIRRWAMEQAIGLDQPATLQRTVRWLAYDPV